MDFSYEVSRALAACEGAVLVVDATQGIEAQTLANLYLALDHDLDIIPVVNKIDLPSARPEEVAQEIEDLLGIARRRGAAGLGQGGDRHRRGAGGDRPAHPPARGAPEGPLRALIFDSHYDSYKGVIAYVRVVDGCISAGDAGHP